MSYKKTTESEVFSKGLTWTLFELEDARQLIAQAIELANAGMMNEEELEFMLGSALSNLAKAWHYRGMTHDEFGSIPESLLGPLENSIPDLGSGTGEFRIVPMDVGRAALEDWYNRQAE